ncbi:hypothetical protein TRIATDRAFT_254468, partial [Trichoderma atroviride IMI 206040]
FCRPTRVFCVAHIYGGWINAWEVYGKNGGIEREEEGGREGGGDGLKEGMAGVIQN